MICDICHPKQKGYTIYFHHESKVIWNYFRNITTDLYRFVSDTTLWLSEPVFFAFLDYAKIHLQTETILAAESEWISPLEDKYPRKKLVDFTAEKEASWIDDIILNNDITSYFQAIVQLKDNKPTIIGYEMLSRGLDHRGDIIPPNLLFDAARKRNRLFSLDRACRLQSVRNASIIPNSLVFINFIPTAIYNPEHCLESTFALIKKLNLNPENIVFEVVETDEINELTHLQSILSYYRKHGFKYALDDVGVGYNNIEKLEAIKPDIVKLAFEYCNGVSNDVEKQVMANAVLEATHRIGALALAEGVETVEDLEYLKEMGFDLFQGYYFAKPSPTPLTQTELENILRMTY
ncbi:EAL domain-containing protein [Bacillus sp. B1-b2]|uniref:EAL domain-containing protein n=1 Tax=Bacillus sp. B1-b2 TaxID=2653201 RepID=UPI0012629571|nr:EAL domain-containing protein [Bacillus sp. B1-b2]KAB7671233.1 EAL domain-containing protein [Bacillus sp. B1-b2]